MDIAMKGLNGIEATRQIRQRFPRTQVIVLSMHLLESYVRQALESGAAGYLLKSMVRKELAGTIRSVHAGKRHIPAEIAAELAAHVADDALSLREIEVLRLVAMGNSNKQIAGQLTIVEETVKAHISNILSKLGANDRTHAVTIATTRGFLGE